MRCHGLSSLLLTVIMSPSCCQQPLSDTEQIASQDTDVQSDDGCKDSCCLPKGGSDEASMRHVLVGACVPDGKGGCERSRGAQGLGCCASGKDASSEGLHSIAMLQL